MRGEWEVGKRRRMLIEELSQEISKEYKIADYSLIKDALKMTLNRMKDKEPYTFDFKILNSSKAFREEVKGSIRVEDLY